MGKGKVGIDVMGHAPFIGYFLGVYSLRIFGMRGKGDCQEG